MPSKPVSLSEQRSVVTRPAVEHPALNRIAFQRVAGLQPEPGLVAARERA